MHHLVDNFEGAVRDDEDLLPASPEFLKIRPQLRVLHQQQLRVAGGCLVKHRMGKLYAGLEKRVK